MFVVPNMALENAMACRVYRAVKLGFIRSTETPHFGFSTRALTASDEEAGHELAFARRTWGQSHNMEIHVDITTTTDIEVYGDHVSGKQASVLDRGSNASDQGYHLGGPTANTPDRGP
jgi:hypothetical protein